MADKIEFKPTKQLFIDTLTRDVSIFDCLLDLLDNSVDSYVRKKFTKPRAVAVTVRKNRIQILDECGGIERERLLNEVFRFGFTGEGSDHHTIGMYGVGLKRSVFKLGNKFEFETDDGRTHLVLKLNVKKWLDAGDDDWSVDPEIDEESNLKKGSYPYTRVTVGELHQETKDAITDKFLNDLRERIGKYYTLLIEHGLSFTLNGVEVTHYPIEIRTVAEMSPSVRKDDIDGIKAKTICWIEPTTAKRTRRTTERRGWNIFMNKRLILHDDMSPETGFSGKKSELPGAHSIFNRFRGLVFLETKSPRKLPVNTSKTGFNRESAVYVKVLAQMVETAKPITKYLSDQYRREEERMDDVKNLVENRVSRDVADVKSESYSLEALSRNQKFKAPKSKKAKVVSQSRVSYQKPRDQIDFLKGYFSLRSNREVGQKTFDIVFNDVKSVEEETD